MMPSWKRKMNTSFLKKQSQINFLKQGHIYGIQKKLSIRPLFFATDLKEIQWYFWLTAFLPNSMCKRTFGILLKYYSSTCSNMLWIKAWSLALVLRESLRLKKTIKLIEENLAQLKKTPNNKKPQKKKTSLRMEFCLYNIIYRHN